MRPNSCAYFWCRWLISIQHKERQLLGTRNKGKEPVISVIHFDGHSLAGWMQQYCSTAMQQCMYPWPQQSSQVHHATGFSGGFKCEFLIGIEAGFGRYLYSRSLHRTESSGTAPNPAAEHISSCPLPRIFDYPANNQPLIRHNLLPMSRITY